MPRAPFSPGRAVFAGSGALFESRDFLLQLSNLLGVGLLLATAPGLGIRTRLAALRTPFVLAEIDMIA